MKEFYDKVDDLLKQEIELNPIKTNDYLFDLKTLKEEYNTHDNIECTLKITTRKKGLVTSVYNQKRDQKWLGKIFEFPKEPRFNLSMLHYGQLLYCSIYFEDYKVDSLYNKVDWIDVTNSVPKKLGCNCLRPYFKPVRDGYNDARLGLNPYQSPVTYNTFTDTYTLSNPDSYNYTIHNCPFCGKNLYKNYTKK